MPGYRLDSLESVRKTAQSASATIGSGTNGVVTASVTAAGGAGNVYTLTVVLGSGANVALSAALSGTDITVTLGTNGGSTADATKNTATLVAAAVGALTGITATASGSGATAIPAAVAIQSLSGGRDIWTRTRLAAESNTSHLLIVQLETGGNCLRDPADRIVNALASTLALCGAAAL